MTALRGYWRTARQYAQSPKGAWDLREYAKVALLLTATILVTMAGLRWWLS